MIDGRVMRMMGDFSSGKVSFGLAIRDRKDTHVRSIAVRSIAAKIGEEKQQTN